MHVDRGMALKPTFPPEDYVNGQRLSIKPCPRCGDPLGARYPAKADGWMVCWSCSGWTPEPPPKLPKRSATVRLRQRVYKALSDAGMELLGDDGHVGGLGDPDVGLAGYCPVCKRGIVLVHVIDANPPELDMEGCSAGCTARQVLGAL
jgi:hypothetical protein